MKRPLPAGFGVLEVTISLPFCGEAGEVFRTIADRSWQCIAKLLGPVGNWPIQKPAPRYCRSTDLSAAQTNAKTGRSNSDEPRGKDRNASLR